MNFGEDPAMNEIRYGFVVLHYMAEDMTIRSVDKLLDTFQDKNIRIVIVDNASSNGSGNELAKYYKNVSNVDVVLVKENVGFARGNNIGYRYIKEKFKPEFIIIMNNDVLINQKNFLNLIDEIYNRTLFGVLGPDIYCPITKLHQNPSRLQSLTCAQIKAEIRLREKMSKYFALYYYKHLTLGRLKRRVLYTPPSRIDWKNEAENVVLHGACYILSENFINKRQDAFNPDTFLYFEEDILHTECLREQIKMVYSPLLRVEHLEDVSTDFVFKSNYKKAKMKNFEMLKSARILDKIVSDNRK